MNTEDHFVPLYEAGIIRIDADGIIWRCKIERRDRWSKRAELVEITPRRMGTLKDNGYLLCSLNVAGKTLSAGNHRIVYRCLVGPIPPGKQINHKDGHKQNNRPDNLEISTPAENTGHAIRTGLRKQKGENHPRAKLKAVDVVHIRWALSQGIRQSEIAVFYGVSDRLISQINRGHIWKSLAG